jgi:hypothetical protein
MAMATVPIEGRLHLQCSGGCPGRVRGGLDLFPLDLRQSVGLAM